MKEHEAAAGSTARFCSQCGARLPEGARFCAGCGHAVGGTVPVSPGARTLHDQIPGLAVLALFLGVGLSIWTTILRDAPPASTAPRRSGPGAAAAGGGMPADHPPLTLPAEAEQFIAQLTAKADAAPSDVETWKNLAQVQARAAEIDPKYHAKAIETYRHVLSLAPDDADAVRSLGNVYYDQQQYTQAAEQYERYLQRVPSDPNVRTDLGTTYLYQRQIDRALEIYHAVIAERPDFLQAHFNLGLAYEAKGEREKALASLATARSLAPDDTTRSRIDRVVAQLQGAPAGNAPPRASGGVPPPAGGTAGAAPGGGADAPGFRAALEKALREHQILGPKITGIEWPDAEHARVQLSGFPADSMPEFARNLFRARLETIIFDAKEQHGIAGARTIELVDAETGATMEKVTQ